MRIRGKKVERKRQRDFKLPLHVQLRTPSGYSPLAEFLLSCEGEVSVDEAIHEYQKSWCDHPAQAQALISTFANPGAERFEHKIACTECGLIRDRQGRPPKKLTQWRAA